MNAIEFENVSKQYRLGLVSTGTIAHDLNRWWTMNVLRREDPYLKIGETNDRSKRGHSDYVWALKDINFSVEQGDVVGIIGKNGAGKSTLLKLLSRVTTPTTGSIKVRGRIASLLEVGTGFHPEMTGRENIFMNGAIMGMTKQEIGRKLDEIVDFSGCERYIDTPVKRYSSGMTVRLGFAIAAHLEPEILVVDEVLAVGDAEFQKKAIGKMQDVAHGQGRTVLFVSHNMSAVKSLCKRGIVLQNGMLSYDGSSIDAINKYIKGETLDKEKKIVDMVVPAKRTMHIEEILFNHSDSVITNIKPGQEYIDVVVKGVTDVDQPADLFVIIKNKDEIPMASFVEGHWKGNIDTLAKGSFEIHKKIKLPKVIATGDYIIDIKMHHPNIEFLMRAVHCVEMHVDGYQEEFGRALKIETEGFIGLESL